jgi:hypothetical protein
MKLEMAIRIEQMDLNNIGKYLLLRKDFKPLLKEVLSAMTEDEKDELGIGGAVIPEKSQLKALIAECKLLVSSAVVGYNIGQYYQAAINNFNSAITTASGALNASIPAMVDATNKLFEAKRIFGLCKVSTDGVLSGGKWYGTKALTNNEFPWVPVKLIAGKYWVSTEVIDTNHPAAGELRHLFGIYVPAQNKIYTRFPLASDITGSGVTQVEGALYNNIWFGSTQAEADTLTAYLGKEIYLIVSDYHYVDANPPVIPKAGDAWFGKAEEMQFLPPTTEECSRIMNIVAALGDDLVPEDTTGPSTNTRLTSTLFTIDETAKTISNIPEGKTVENLLAGVVKPAGSTVVVKNVSNANVTTGLLATNFKIGVTAEDGVSTALYTIYVTAIVAPPTTDYTQPQTLGTNYYGPTPPPTNSGLTWIPTKVIGTTFISQSPIPLAYPNASNLTSLVGTYVPSLNKVYTRHELSQAVVDAGITKVDGALYNSIWFGITDESANLKTYLATEVYYVPSEYKHIDANPPIIPESGDAWYGPADYVTFLPGTVAELKRTFKCVAVFGK